jgi:threonine dehydrogenase-like Zn-dependent dehydrogenase
MRALVYEGPHRMRVRDVERPAPDGDEVLIEVAFSGICGSELSGYLGQNSLRGPDTVFGHELSGRVVALGPDVCAADGLEVGMRVTANPLVTCLRCRWCRSGRSQLCPYRKLLSASLPGSNAELVKAPARCVRPLPDSLTLQQGAFTEPAACAVRAAAIGRAAPEDRALVVGSGPIGLLVAQALRVRGVAEIMVSDLNPGRLEMADRLGVVTHNPSSPGAAEALAAFRGENGVDVAFDAVGADATRRTCVESCAPGGRVVLIGLHDAEATLPANVMVRNEIECLGSFSYTDRDFDTALRWLAQGRVGFGAGVVESTLEEGADWFERLLAGDDAVKVLLDPRVTP